MAEARLSTTVDSLTASSRRMLQRVTFYILLIFGGILTFVVPPLQSPDEDSHLIRAVMIADGQLKPRFDGTRWGQDVPKTLVDYVESHRYMIGDTSKQYSYGRWYVDSHLPQSKSETVFHSYSGQSTSPFYYLPQIAGIWFGKTLYLVAPAEYNWSAAQYFARLGNVIAYAAVFAWAVCVLPRFIGILTFLAMTPMSLTLAASASYDVTVILSAVIFFAACMRAVERPDGPSRTDIALLLLTSFMLGQSKAVYVPLLALVLMFARPIGLKRTGILLAYCVAAAIVGIACSTIVFGLPADAGLRAAIQAQSAYVSQHLFSMPLLVLNALYTSRDFLFGSLLGNLGWLDTHFPMPALVLWFGVGLWAVASDAVSGPTNDPFLKAGLMVVATAVSIFGVFLAMYVVWTSHVIGIGVNEITGVQGRYLLPLVPVALGATAVVLARWIPKASRYTRARMLRFQHAISCIIGTLTVFTFLARYWIPVSG